MAPGVWARAVLRGVGLGVCLASISAPAARAVITAETRACFAAVESAISRHGRVVCAAALSQGSMSAAALAGAFTDRGRAHLMLKDYAKARRAFAKAVELTPDRASAYNNLGVALAAEGRHEQAVAQFDQALERDPGYGEAYLNRALSNRALGAFDAALSDFGDTRRLAPELLEAHRRRVGGAAPALLARKAPEPDTAEIETGTVVEQDRKTQAEPTAAEEKRSPIGSTLVSMLDYDATVAAEFAPRPKPAQKASAKRAGAERSIAGRSLAQYEQELKTKPWVTRRVQEALAKAGYEPGPIDGLYGPSTRSAVMACLRDGRGDILR